MKGMKDAFARKMRGKNTSPTTPAAPTPTTPSSPPVRMPAVWDATTFNVHLKMAKNRIDIQRAKKENEIDSTRTLIAGHLATNKEPLARIQADRVLRERSQLDAFDIVITFINVLSHNNKVFGMQRDFDTSPANIKEGVASVVFASSRLNIPELHKVTDMFRSHFGAGVIDPLLRLEGPHISQINKVLARVLEGGTPDGYLVLEELTQIAKEKELSWIPPPEDIDLDRGPYGAHDPGYYRPVPLPYVQGGGFGGMPPPPDAGGPGVYGGVGPMNIPGHNPYGPVPPYGAIHSDNTSNPSAPPSAPPPSAPFDPPEGDGMYPYPDFHAGQHGGPGSNQPPPPPASFLSDDDLEAKYRNARDNRVNK